MPAARWERSLAAALILVGQPGWALTPQSFTRVDLKIIGAVNYYACQIPSGGKLT